MTGSEQEKKQRVRGSSVDGQSEAQKVKGGDIEFEKLCFR